MVVVEEEEVVVCIFVCMRACVHVCVCVCVRVGKKGENVCTGWESTGEYVSK